MMRLNKKLYLSALLMFTFFPGHAQNITLITNKIEDRYNAENDTAQPSVREKLTIAVKNKKWSAAAKASADLGNFNFSKLRYHQAIQNNLQGVVFAQKAGDINSEMQHFYGIGLAFYQMFNYPSAMEFFMKALKVSSNKGDPQMVLKINNQIGMIYKYLADYDKAMEYFLPAYREAQRLGKGPLADLLINIGNVQEAQGHYYESIEYYEKYLLLKPTDPFTQVIANNNIGTVYIKLGELDKASACFTKAYAVEDTIVNPMGRAYSFYDFAMVAQARGGIQSGYSVCSQIPRGGKTFQYKKPGMERL